MFEKLFKWYLNLIHEKYHFKTDGLSTCLEECKVIGGWTMIGSVSCQQCKFNVNQYDEDYHGEYPEWIQCTRLKKAIGENNV